MYFANPWGLLGLLALPAIVVIHMYHRRFPPVLVAGLHLWSSEVRQPTAGRKRERPPITRSLLLELLAALLLSLILSQPRFGEIDRVLHLIAVLDGSASMSAVGSQGASFRDIALAELQRRMTAAPRGSVITVIATGRRPVMVAGPAVNWDDARERLEQWEPTATKHEFSTSLDMAGQLAATSGKVLFITDHMPSESDVIPDKAEILAIGEPLNNVAVIAAKWSLDPKTLAGRVFVRLANRGARAVPVNVSGKVGDKTVFEASAELDSGAERSFETEVPGGLGSLRVTVAADKDPLAIDNSVDLIEPKLRPVKVAIELPKEHAAKSSIERVIRTLPDVSLVSGGGSADLQIATAQPLPAADPRVWWLGVGPIDPSEAARGKAKDLVGPYVIDKRHPLMDGVLLSGVVWAGVQPMDYAVTPLITAGSQMLLARLDGTPTTAYMLNLDLAKSNITESPDWPILLSNFVEQRRENLPGLRRWNYRVNETMSFRLFEGKETEAATARKLTLKHEATSKELARTGIVELPPLDQTGIYALVDGEQELERFAVNFFDLDESTLSQLRSGQRAPVEVSEDSGYEVDMSLTWLMLIGIMLILAVAFADWYVLRPKTV